jgi:hypothetical protein
VRPLYIYRGMSATLSGFEPRTMGHAAARVMRWVAGVDFCLQCREYVRGDRRHETRRRPTIVARDGFF